jgi:hypothetical protein
MDSKEQPNPEQLLHNKAKAALALGEIYEANIGGLSGALKIMRGYWNYDSGFFDTSDCTVKTSYLRKKLGIDKTAYRSVYCLVPVDFHF